MKKFKGTKGKNVSLRNIKMKYDIGVGFKILYDGIPQCEVKTHIGHHNPDEVLANAILFSQAYDNLLFMQELAEKVKLGEKLEYESIVSQINKSC